MVDELAEHSSGLHVCWREVGHEFLCCYPVQPRFESFELLPQALDVVQGDLHRPMVDLAQRVHFLLFLPCRAGLKNGENRVLERIPTRTYFARLQKLNIVAPDLPAVFILPDVVQSKLIGDSDIIALRRRDIEATEKSAHSDQEQQQRKQFFSSNVPHLS